MESQFARTRPSHVAHLSSSRFTKQTKRLDACVLGAWEACARWVLGRLCIGHYVLGISQGAQCSEHYVFYVYFPGVSHRHGLLVMDCRERVVESEL